MHRPIFWVKDSSNYTRMLQLCHRMGRNDLVELTGMRGFQRLGARNIAIHSPRIEDLPEIQQSVLPFFKNFPNDNCVFDLSVEPICFDGYTGDKFKLFHDRIEGAGLNPGQLFFLCASPSVEEQYEAWRGRENIANKLTMVGYDFYLFEYFWELSLNKWFKENHFGFFEKAKGALAGKKRKANFLCLNLRPKKHRIATVLHLLEKGHETKGLISFHGEAFGSTDSEVSGDYRKSLAEIGAMPSGGRLLSALPKLMRKIPLVVERQDGDLRKDLWQRKPGEIDFLIPELEPNNEVPELCSYFEFVTETWFPSEASPLITEKTIRPIVRLQPFIQIGPPGNLRHLRELGFQTFSPYIDESYDDVLDADLRLEKIFKEIDKIAGLSADEVHDFYCTLWPVVEHNFWHLLTQTPKIFNQQMQSRVLPQFPQSNLLQHIFARSECLLNRTGGINNQSFIVRPQGPYNVF